MRRSMNWPLPLAALLLAATLPSLAKDEPASAKAPPTPAPVAVPAPAPEVTASTENTATKPTPRDAGWIKRSDAFTKQAKQGNVDLLFIGDSITDRWREAKPVWNKYYGKRRAMNIGIRGDATQQVLWRLDHGNVDGLKPKLAVLMIGTNNSNGNENTAEQIGEGITAIVKKLKEKLPESKVLILAIFPRGAGPSPQREKNAKASELAAKLADDKQVFYLDIGPKFLEADGQTLNKEYMLPDLLHLSEKGYETWAEAIESKVAELLGEKQ